jgi:hypothetical protein
MGALEHELIARLDQGADGCTRWLTAELAERVRQASEAISDADKGMGFRLPAPHEIATLCDLTVRALLELSGDRDSPDFRLGIADIFGASVRMALRKQGVRRFLPAGRLRQDHPTLDQVVCAFPPHIARLLDPGRLVLPDIQTSPIPVLENIFPASDWRYGVSPDGLRDLSPATARPSFTVCVPRPGPLLMVLRLYVAVEARPFRIALWNDTGELAGFDAYRPDSLLLSPIVQCAADAPILRLSIRTLALGSADAQDVAANFTLSYAGAFPL